MKTILLLVLLSALVILGYFYLIPQDLSLKPPGTAPDRRSQGGGMGFGVAKRDSYQIQTPSSSPRQSAPQEASSSAEFRGPLFSQEQYDRLVNRLDSVERQLAGLNVAHGEALQKIAQLEGVRKKYEQLRKEGVASLRGQFLRTELAKGYTVAENESAMLVIDLLERIPQEWRIKEFVYSMQAIPTRRRKAPDNPEGVQRWWKSEMERIFGKEEAIKLLPLIEKN